MDIQDLRAQIDQIDEKLVPLFLERMGVSLKVAEYKAQKKVIFFTSLSYIYKLF